MSLRLMSPVSFHFFNVATSKFLIAYGAYIIISLDITGLESVGMCMLMLT